MAMRPCLSAALTMSCSFADDVAHFADVGCHAMEVWLTKLEEHLERHSVATTKKLVADRGLELIAAAYQGGLLLSEGEARRSHFDHFRRRLDLCSEFGVPTLLIAADHASEVAASMLQRAMDSLAEAAQWAESYGVRLALEFRGRGACCTSLETALALVQQCGAPNVGINFDVFHYYTGPSKAEDLTLLTLDRLFHVQLCDLAGVPREVAVDADRILPGDGDFHLQSLLDQFRRLGYDGWVAVETFNRTFWQMNPTQVAETAITALRKVLGLAVAQPRQSSSAT
ncbi:MAG: sugar phosphate isomerase/epimerase [Gemmataceae bacterium]|nr:sugar phosphate isomerase/epimerase [Gemmataceae bacterium]